MQLLNKIKPHFTRSIFEWLAPYLYFSTTSLSPTTFSMQNSPENILLLKSGCNNVFLRDGIAAESGSSRLRRQSHSACPRTQSVLVKITSI